MKPYVLFATAVLLAASAVHGQTLELADCRINAGPAYPGIKARCGTFVRPQDPGEPNGEQLDLFVAVVPALTLEPAPDPLRA